MKKMKRRICLVMCIALLAAALFGWYGAGGKREE